MNLRFQAFDQTLTQGSSIGGTSGLMLVEKSVSLNVKRVAQSGTRSRGPSPPTTLDR